ncbi:ATP-dependent DNA helicase sgs1, partial [Podila clonocystis]
RIEDSDIEELAKGRYRAVFMSPEIMFGQGTTADRYYSCIGTLRGKVPGVPIVGLTATLPPESFEVVKNQVFLPSSIVKVIRVDDTHAYFSARVTSAKDEAMLKFINNETDVLLATDACGMGCDISDVITVIQYDLPQDLTSLVQRFGRAARRPGLQGFAILLAPPITNDKYNKRPGISEFVKAMMDKKCRWEIVDEYLGNTFRPRINCCDVCLGGASRRKADLPASAGPHRAEIAQVIMEALSEVNSMLDDGHMSGSQRATSAADQTEDITDGLGDGASNKGISDEESILAVDGTVINQPPLTSCLFHKYTLTAIASTLYAIPSTLDIITNTFDAIASALDIITNTFDAIASALDIIANSFDALVSTLNIIANLSTSLQALSTSSPILSTSSPTLATSSPTLATSLPTLLTSSPTLSTSSPTLSTSSPTLATSSPTLSTSSPTLSTSLPTLSMPSRAPSMPSLALSTSSPTLSTSSPTLSTSLPTLSMPSRAPSMPSLALSTSSPTLLTSLPILSTSLPTLSTPSRAPSMHRKHSRHHRQHFQCCR